MSSNGDSKPTIAEPFRRYFARPETLRILVTLGCFLLIFILTAQKLANPRSTLPKVGDVSRTQYRAEFPVTYVNTQATQIAREEAAESVSPIFVPDINLNAQMTQNMRDFFDLISDYSEKIKDAKNPRNVDSQDEISTAGEKRTPAEIETEALAVLTNHLETSLSIRRHFIEPVTEDDLKNLLSMNAGELGALEALVDQSLAERINRLITSDENNLLDEAENLRNTVMSKASGTQMSSELRKLATKIAVYFIMPNATLDRSMTEKARQDARDATPEVMGEVSKNEIYVRAGEKITQEDIDIMNALGLTSDYAPLIAWIKVILFFMLLGIAFILGNYYLPGKTLPQLNDQRYFLLFYAILIITFLASFFVIQTVEISKTGSLQSFNMMFATLPIVVGAVLFSHYFNRMLTAVVSGFIAIIVAYASAEPTTIIPAIFTSYAASLIIKRDCPRHLMMKAFVLLPIIWAVSVLAAGYSVGLDLSGLQARPWLLIFGFAPAPLASMLANIILDTSFNIPTANRLREFDSQDHPLLRKLQLEAPGTWHHSMMMGLIAEAACQAVGGNTLLVRVACMYHDIGKSKRPEFFIENQRSGANVHDKYSPWLSKIIVESHVKDGIALARSHGLPDELIDMIPQHHGTTLIKYFFRKALAISQDGYVNEYDYRYPGPKPQTLEAACINLADAAESACRSLEEPTPHRIKSVVEKIYEERLLDGQYDECGLALNQLEIIKETIIQRLTGAYHARIEYPEEDELRRQLQLKRAESEKKSGKDAPPAPGSE